MPRLLRLLCVGSALCSCACSASLRRGLSATEAVASLEQVTRSHENELDPAVSRDGKSIAYDVVGSPGATPHVEIAPLDSVGRAPPARLEDGREPAWMPDGSGLLFVSGAGGSSRVVQTFGPSAEKTAWVSVAGNPDLFASWPALSPDGARVAVSLGAIDLYRTGWRRAMPLDPALGVTDLFGSGVTILGRGSDPAWSPDGRRIAFVRRSDGHAHVFVANADGSGAQQITDGAADDERPSWSPDGRSIVFCSVPSLEGSPWQSANLFVVGADGSDLVQLTEGDRVACRPDWAGDGAIYFHANAGSRFHVWRIRLRGAR